MPSRAAIAAALLLAVPAASAAPAEDALRVSGTGTALGAMRRLAAAYQAAHPGEKVVLLPSVGSGGALKAVAQGALDLGLSGRELRPEEKALGLQAFPYARTPLLFAAGPRAGVEGLTLAEAVRIYRGEQLAWPNGERVRLVLRPRSDVDTALVAAIAPALAEAMERALAREGMLMAMTNQECDELLARTPGAVGPSSLTQLHTEDLPLRPLAWHGVAPTLENLASGRYPLVKTLYLVVRQPAGEPVRRFATWLGTPAAARILEDAGNLPVALPRLP